MKWCWNLDCGKKACRDSLHPSSLSLCKHSWKASLQHPQKKCVCVCVCLSSHGLIPVSVSMAVPISGEFRSLSCKLWSAPVSMSDLEITFSLSFPSPLLSHHIFSHTFPSLAPILSPLGVLVNMTQQCCGKPHILGCREEHVRVYVWKTDVPGHSAA